MEHQPDQPDPADQSDLVATPLEDAATGDDPLLAVRARLDEVDQLPLEGRAEVFEQTHRIVVDELRALELG